MSSSSIKVAVRCRPLLGQERPTGGLDIQGRRILLDAKTYDPDYTFPPTATQDDIFLACRPILQCVKEGMNGTIMVYGQTGTGKTYTMLGDDNAEVGLVHKVVGHMLEHVQQKTADGGRCALTLSMVEIYNERLTDMLSPNGEEEVTLISGFPRFTHKSTLCRVSDAIATIQLGLAWRHTAATLMNDRSSRSHVVFIFDLEEYNAFTDQMDVAHLFLIDLAGSESLKKSQASGVAAGEAGKINKSLLALKSVFLALSNTNEATRPSHVPYRDSKLTELLQDSIGGTARTLMIACISAVGRDIEETKSTLLYAVKARSIRNAANTEKEKLLVRLRSMEMENQKLRNRLQERVNERGGYYVTKEEHEQTQTMEEEHGRMKDAVEQLMHDRQNSDARQHIWESQVQLLHALLEDKGTELEKFKEVYYEALRRFEHQSMSLQNLVRGGVGEAKEAVQLSFADSYAQLHSWRTELLNALEDPLPTSIPERYLNSTGNEEVGPAPTVSASQQVEELVPAPSSGDRVATPPHTQPFVGSRSALPSTSLLTPPNSPMRADGTTATSASTHVSVNGGGRLLGAAGRSTRVSLASSCSVSPTKRGPRPRPYARRGLTSSHAALPTSPSLRASQAPSLLPLPTSVVEGEERAASTQPAAVVVEAADALTVVPARVQAESPSWAVVLEQYDVQCLRAVQRTNAAIVAVLDTCLQIFSQYRTQADSIEQRRRRNVEEVCGRLRSELESSMNQLQRLEGSSGRDLHDARETAVDQLRLKGMVPPTAEASVFQHALRDACTEVVRHATRAFPHPSTPAHAEASLDGIAQRLAGCSANFMVQALDPLSSSAINPLSFAPDTFATANSSAASSPRIGKLTAGIRSSPLSLELGPMQALTPPLIGAVTEGVSPTTSPTTSSPAVMRVPARVSTSPTPEEVSGSLGRGGTGQCIGPLRSARASSLRSSAALSAVPMNRLTGRPTEGRRGVAGASSGATAAGRCKRTRSSASSQMGSEAGCRRTTSTHRSLR